jgi:SAM-dependent methyltransferase
MVRLAKERSVRHPNIEFAVGDFLTMDLPTGTFDCIATVAALHHMPWLPAIDRAKELLRAGGTLLIVDLFQDDGLSDFLSSGVAWVLQWPERLRRGRAKELRDAWAEHGRGDSYLTLSEVRQLCRTNLPGARARRHLFWRYSVVWTKAA